MPESRDPAVEAARRAWGTPAYFATHDPQVVMECAAREALAPIRALHKPYITTGALTGGTWCRHSLSPWPCDTARLIFSTDELEGMNR